MCSFIQASIDRKCRIATRRFDFVRGFHGSHVRDYVRATEPSFVVGEYWDSLSYNGGLPDHNQVLAPVGASDFSVFSQNCLDLEAPVLHSAMHAETGSSISRPSA